MRIYLSLDAEGCTGLCDFSEVEPGSPLYPRGISAMEHDLRGVLAGAREAGATEFYLCDAHGGGKNLPFTELGEDVHIIRGSGHPFSMMAGINLAQFDGAFFIGYHAKNASGGIMGHTYYPGVVKKAFVSGREVGEFGLNVPLAWAFGIPALLASGDDVFLEEVRAVSPRTECCQVKEALSPSCALCYDAARTSRELHAYAKTVVLECRRNKRIPAAVEGKIIIEFETPQQAELAAAHGEAIGDNQVLYSDGTYPQAFVRAVAGMAKAARGSQE